MVSKFIVNEGSFPLPPNFIDKTVNIFALKTEGGVPLNLNVARDKLEPKENFEQYSARQVELMKKQFKKFELQKRHHAKLASGLLAVEIKSLHEVAKKAIIHHHQIGLLLNDGVSILVFSVSSNQPITPEQSKLLIQVVNGFSSSN